jgi:branched-chain amino acid transport system substrate-binding protein
MKRTAQLLILLAALTLLSGVSPSFAETKSITVGFLAPMSGDNADLGATALEGVKLALKDLGKNSATKINLVVEDERCDGRTAVTALDKLIAKNKIHALIHAGCSGSVLSTAPIITRNKLPTIIPMASAAQISNSSPYIYRVVPNDSGIAKKIAKDIAAKKRKKIVILYEETNYCSSLHNNLTEELTKLAGVSFFSGSYLADETKFSTILTKLKSKSPDTLVLIPNSERNAIAQLKAKYELGWHIETVIPYFTTESLIQTIGAAMTEGVLSVDAPKPEEILKGEGKAYFENYLASRVKPLPYPFWLVASYEATRALITTADDISKVDERLLGAHFDGLWGPWHFNKNHEIDGISFVTRKVINGKLVLVE